MRRAPLLLLLALLAPSTTSMAQDALFGSLDDPTERSRQRVWNRQGYVDARAGFSLIGAQWRTAAQAILHAESPAGVVHLDASARAGVFGGYDEDFDESYDLLRVIEYARFQPRTRRDRAVYVRLGPLTRTRLGNGHLVNFLRSDSDRDERSVGVEARLEGPLGSISGFSDDVLVSGLVGGHLNLIPAPLARGALGTLSVQGGVVSDLGSWNDTLQDPVTALQAGVRIRAVRSGAFGLWPFVSVADFTRYGRGLFFGADLVADTFIDIARIHLRVAVHYAGEEFIPDYFGSFYPVENTLSRVLRTEDGPQEFAAIALADAPGGTHIVTELRLHFLDRFEFWYAFRRHEWQAISTYHLRLAMNARRFRFRLAQDRGGLSGFFSLFNDVGDQSVLSFRVAYRVLGPLWLHADAWYGYDRVETDGEMAPRYIVERRFEPFAGLRLRL